jgi:hypothetical protein
LQATLRAIARRHKAAVLRDRKVRYFARAAREIALLLEGCVALILIHGNNHYATVAAEAARRLLTAK